MGMAAILIKLSFPHPIKPPDEIWLWLAYWFLRSRCLKSVDDGWPADGACLYYKLTHESEGSDELNIRNGEV